MGTIYQLTFFLALGLLAIQITIFVFAVSLLGRAMEAAAKNEKEKLLERKENNEEAMAKIKKKIEEAEGQIPKGLTHELRKLERKDEKFEKEVSRIRKAPALLTVKGGVVPPGASLLGALAFICVAWYLYTIENLAGLIPLVIWIVGLAAIGYSIFRICCSLKVIENVAITSEEAALKRTVEAYKVAQKELEEEKKPKLGLNFEGARPPFRIEVGSQITLRFGLYLTQGDLARKPHVYFFAPSSFVFPGKKTWLQDADVTQVGGHITAVFQLEECRKGVTPLEDLTIKAPPVEGKFPFWYKITCEGFDSGLEKFAVIVKKSKTPVKQETS